jgi:N6-L-threonylcarbamoyladenine synthase
MIGTGAQVEGFAVLGLESSCDETAAAVLRWPDGAILAEAVLSQQEEHAPFGGVVPEIAARAHLTHLPRLTEQVMTRAGIPFRHLAGVAATSGPGLIGGLIVGASFGKGLAIAHGLPFVAVNHLEAHALTARLPGLLPAGPVPFPYLLLLLSGGHCQCVAVAGLGRYRRLGTTLDDAVGEAFDKAAKLLGLPWPGGPALERLAAQARDPGRFPLPRPMLGRPGCDFSFSGLKTAVAHAVAKLPKPLPEADRADLAAAFQASAAAVLADRAAHALAAMPPGDGQPTALVVAGGVAANATVRAAVSEVAARAGVPMIAPPARLCTDNAVMVAWAGIERLRAGLTDPLDHAPRPRWPLEELTRVPPPPSR